jgi:hypothetical protein
VPSLYRNSRHSSKLRATRTKKSTAQRAEVKVRLFGELSCNFLADMMLTAYIIWSEGSSMEYTINFGYNESRFLNERSSRSGKWTLKFRRGVSRITKDGRYVSSWHRARSIPISLSTLTSAMRRKFAFYRERIYYNHTQTIASQAVFLYTFIYQRWRTFST